MDERRQRYRQKINFIVEKINSFPPNPKNALEVDALLYRVEVAIEAAMDIVAMLIRDKGKSVSDDYHNLDQLGTLNIISPVLALELKRLNGLRNAIVHKYNRFEEETVIQNKEHIRKTLQEFLQRIDYELRTSLAKPKA